VGENDRIESGHVLFFFGCFLSLAETYLTDGTENIRQVPIGYHDFFSNVFQTMKFKIFRCEYTYDNTWYDDGDIMSIPLRS